MTTDRQHRGECDLAPRDPAGRGCVRRAHSRSPRRPKIRWIHRFDVGVRPSFNRWSATRRLICASVGYAWITFGEVLGAHPFRQREHVLGDQLAGVRADDRGAEELALRIGDDLGEAFRFAFGARAVDFVERETVDAVRDVALLRLDFGEPDARELRIGDTCTTARPARASPSASERSRAAARCRRGARPDA